MCPRRRPARSNVSCCASRTTPKADGLH
ncbi:MAG: hypothetical protein ACJ8EA_20960 [Xanthobacteraceae bacterium]